MDERLVGAKTLFETKIQTTGVLATLVLSSLCACGPRAQKSTHPVEPKAPPEPPPAPVEEAPKPPPPPKLVLRPATFAELPGWQDDQVGEALPALLKSCRVLSRRRGSRPVGRTRVAGVGNDWKPACADAAKIESNNHEAARAFFESHFEPFLAMNNDDPEGGFTGYYEASLRGSRKRRGRYQTPLYKRPNDLVMVNLRNFIKNPKRRRIAGRVVNGLLKPYETRAQIRNGSLRGKGLELVWIDDPIDGFFTQIQGSGRVELQDGSVMRIGYAGQNGHPYTAIGRELVKDGHITKEEMSMQAIRKWLHEHPEEAGDMMDRNQAYVFFTKVDRDGAIGSQGVELTPERSAAIDRNFIPQSVPLFIDTTVPDEDGTQEVPFQKLLIAQDSGGAIRGPVRADIFWGAGSRAANIAGRLKSRGRYFLLLPKTLSAEKIAARR